MLKIGATLTGSAETDVRNMMKSANLDKEGFMHLCLSLASAHIYAISQGKETKNISSDGTMQDFVTNKVELFEPYTPTRKYEPVTKKM